MLYGYDENGLLTSVRSNSANRGKRETTVAPPDGPGPWYWRGGEWKSEPEPEPTKVSPVEFKLLWKSAERINLRTLRDTDPVLADFWDIVEDPRITEVNLGLPSTKNSVTYAVQQLVDNGTIAATDEATRIEQILAGEMQ